MVVDWTHSRAEEKNSELPPPFGLHHALDETLQDQGKGRALDKDLKVRIWPQITGDQFTTTQLSLLAPQTAVTMVTEAHLWPKKQFFDE